MPRLRYDIWACRLGTLAVGLAAGGFYVVRRGRPLGFDNPGAVSGADPQEDVVLLAIMAGVIGWLLVSLAIARRRERVRDRVVPGLVLGSVVGVALAVGAGNSDWPLTVGDAATTFVIGLFGSSCILLVPGSLRENPWTRAKRERE